MLALLGVLSIIIGLWAVRHAVLTLVALIVFLGIFWVINGLIEISPRSPTGICPTAAGLC